MATKQTNEAPHGRTRSRRDRIANVEAEAAMMEWDEVAQLRRAQATEAAR